MCCALALWHRQRRFAPDHYFGGTRTRNRGVDRSKEGYDAYGRTEQTRHLQLAGFEACDGKSEGRDNCDLEGIGVIDWRGVLQLGRVKLKTR